MPHDLAGWPVLDDTAEVHHGDPVGEVRGGGQVVGDHEDAHLPVPAQSVQQGQHPRADRDVEHGHRLVRQQQVGAEHERRGDRYPLALAAGQLVRVAGQEGLRRGQARAFQRRDDQFPAFGRFASDSVHEQGFTDGRLHPEPRVERFVGVLVDHLQLASQRPHLALGQAGDLGPVQPDRSAGRRDHPEDGLRRGGLTAARLADQGQHLAPGERETHPVHRVHPEPGLAGDPVREPAPYRIEGGQILDLEQGNLLAAGQLAPARSA